MMPVKTVAAGPVSQTCSPGPGHDTWAVPPGKSTRTSASRSPWRRPTAAAAHAPVPQARVSPTPALEHAQTDVAAVHDLHEAHVGAPWKARMALDARPRGVPRARPSRPPLRSTACGLPIETAPILDRFALRRRASSAAPRRAHPSAATADRNRARPCPRTPDPSRRTRACTVPPGLSMDSSRPSCGALAYRSAAIHRAPLPHCSTSPPSELKIR